MFTDDLADPVRHFLSNQSNVREQKMFGRIAFMVNDKRCITAGTGRIMLRIDPAGLQEPPFKGFIYVDESELTDIKNLGDWLNKALRFNKQQPIEKIQAATTPSTTAGKSTKRC
jgi:hypothetical protein